MNFIINKEYNNLPTIEIGDMILIQSSKGHFDKIQCDVIGFSDDLVSIKINAVFAGTGPFNGSKVPVSGEDPIYPNKKLQIEKQYIQTVIKKNS